ncbi:unnamed protein product [Closterium sp. Naga37s-1]|nr:unnamed protein product [Closterium sp. Naga37s-1]
MSSLAPCASLASLSADRIVASHLTCRALRSIIAPAVRSSPLPSDHRPCRPIIAPAVRSSRLPSDHRPCRPIIAPAVQSSAPQPQLTQSTSAQGPGKINVWPSMMYGRPMCIHVAPRAQAREFVVGGNKGWAYGVSGWKPNPAARVGDVLGACPSHVRHYTPGASPR